MEIKMEDKVKLTSVKLLSDLYKSFKRESLVTEFTLQKLINRCLHRYVSDEDFRKRIHEHENLQISGSQF